MDLIERYSDDYITGTRMKKLSQKVILVTGGSKGIGLGCVLTCLKYGARVGILSLESELAAAEVAKAGFSTKTDIFMAECDVRAPSDFQCAFEQALTHFGKIDGLINNAGWHPPALEIEDISVEDFENLVRLNLTSSFLGCKLAVPHLKKTKGAIVNMSSEAGLIGQPAAAAYASTKAGQLGLTKALALDLAPHGVRVNAVCPAGVMTPLMKDWAATEYDPEAALKMVDEWHPIGRMATPGEMGEVCAFLLSSEASFITGQTICPDGGATLGYRR